VGLIISNPGAPLVYHEVAAATYTHTQVNNNAWEDWDLSAIAGAIMFDISTGFNNSTNGVRQKGSGLDRKLQSFTSSFTVLPNASGLVETYDITGEVFRVVGYWT